MKIKEVLNLRIKASVLFLIEAALVGVFLFFFINNIFVSGGIGENVTVTTLLQVGNVSPEILNVSINNASASVTLVANSTVTVGCVAIIRDFNNDTTLANVTGTFFDTIASSYGAADDNNNHYTNSSCNITTNFTSWNEVIDDQYLALANCSFSVYYYANPQTWNCTIFANDTTSLSAYGSDTISVSQLLSIGMPNTINYGTVNATFVSNENITSVTNLGNVRLNLSLSGYGLTEGDNLSMKCTLGSVGNISVSNEKYNLTVSNPGSLTLTNFEANYTNLTSSVVTKGFGLPYRQNDTFQGIDDTNSTHWRIYVPLGVAGSCNGSIIFGATTAVGS